MSDSRSVGIQWFDAFQSVAQIIARWGENDGRQILANHNCSIVLGGLQDEKALDRFSALVGDTEISAALDPTNTATGTTVTTVTTTLRAEEVRLIPDEPALVIYRSAPAMLVNLIPWTQRPERRRGRGRVGRRRTGGSGGHHIRVRGLPGAGAEQTDLNIV